MIHVLFAIAACWNVAGFFVAWVTYLHRPSTAPLADRAVDAGAARTLLELEARERAVAFREELVRLEAAEQSRTRAEQVTVAAELEQREGELRALSLEVLAEVAAAAGPTLAVAWDDATPMLPAGEPVMPAWLSDMSIYDAISDWSGGPVADDVPVVDEPQPGGPAPTQDEPDADESEWTPDPVAYAELVDAQQPVDVQVMAFGSLGELVEAAATGAVAVELAVEAQRRVTHKLNKRSKVGSGRRA